MNVNSCKNKSIIIYANDTKYAYKDKNCSIKLSKNEVMNIYNKGCLIYKNFENEKKEVYEIPFACVEENNYINIYGATFDIYSSEYIESTS